MWEVENGLRYIMVRRWGASCMVVHPSDEYQQVNFTLRDDFNAL